MFKKILRGLFTLLGGFCGYLLATLLITLPKVKELTFLQTELSRYIVFGVLFILFAIIFFLLSNLFVKVIYLIFEFTEKYIQKIPISELILGVLGGIITLTLFYFTIGRFIDGIKIIGPVIGMITKILVFVLGAQIAIKKKDEIIPLSFFGKGKSSNKLNKKNEIPKILDTSVIIDGRIFDICKTGFIEGPLVIPSAVLEELQYIADSSDSLKRNRGRRGLDILNKIQKELEIDVKIWDKEINDAKEVDIKLLKLAKEINGKVVTNDYNLNKVAEFQGVEVLNINELANAVKPILLPGEEMSILVSKVGKEHNQGIAYLDDGTMIVIENGKKYVDSTIDVVVTTVLQTAAGRMIFARPKDENGSNQNK